MVKIQTEGKTLLHSLGICYNHLFFCHSTQLWPPHFHFLGLNCYSRIFLRYSNCTFFVILILNSYAVVLGKSIQFFIIYLLFLLYVYTLLEFVIYVKLFLVVFKMHIGILSEFLVRSLKISGLGTDPLGLPSFRYSPAVEKTTCTIPVRRFDADPRGHIIQNKCEEKDPGTVLPTRYSTGFRP